ncbi:hypothetical protein Tco_0046064 [Tanacetum coccineum]
MTKAQQGNENLETTQEQVVKDTHVTISNVSKKTKVPVTCSSRSSDLASKFLNFSDIPQTDAEIVSPLDVHVHHEVPRTQAPTLLTIPTTPTPPLTIETTNPLSNLLDFSSVFRLNNRITVLEKEVVDLKKDTLYTQFKKPTPPQEPIDPDWNIGKTTREGPTQNWLMTLAASTSTDKILKDFDKLMSTPIDFSGYILNDLKIENLTQEVLFGPAFRLLKGTRSSYAELEYDFEECYKALSKNLD